MKGIEGRYDVDALISSLSQDKVQLSRLLSKQIRRGEAKTNELAGAEQRCEEADARAQSAEVQLAAVRHQIDHAHHEIEALRTSTSWRITRPVRALKRLLAGKSHPSPASQAPAAQSLVTPEDGASAPITRRISRSIYEGMRIVWIGAEPDTPGYRYRVQYLAEAAKAVGADVTHHRLDAADTYLGEIGHADIVVLWRTPWMPEVARVVDAVRQRGAILIFDIDDLMIEPRVVRTKYIDGIRSQRYDEASIRGHFELVRKTMHAADLCTATTHELAAHFRVHQMPTFVMPNGFNANTLRVSRMAARARRAAQPDGLFRIGYAGGSKTHQKDFSVCVPALAAILQRYAQARLVVFHDGRGTCILDFDEFPELAEFESQIEWRVMVPLAELPTEMARFDVSLAPLEVGNFFCEAKSELKYFEAALVDVLTVASPTDPYRRAIRQGVTGFLANSTTQWYEALAYLIEHPEHSRQMARAALNDVLWKFGPEYRVERMASLIDMALRGRSGARAFAFEAFKEAMPRRQPEIPSSRVVFEHDRLVYSKVTVVVPLYNYERYVLQALESVATQTLQDIDLVVVDDCSTDQSLAVVVEWCEANQHRFNRLLVVQNAENSKLGPTRNAGFDAADTPYVITLDADNRLLPECAEKCLEVAEHSAAAFVYPLITTFGADTFLMGDKPYDPTRFIGGNFIDAMALISKGAWACVGGYDNVPHGWEDYEFWCKLAERGLFGMPQGGSAPLAEYRIHSASMLRQHTNVEENLARTTNYLLERHSWLEIATDRVGRAMKEEHDAAIQEAPTPAPEPEPEHERLRAPGHSEHIVSIMATGSNSPVKSCRSCKNVRRAIRTEDSCYGSVVERHESEFLHCGLRFGTEMRQVVDVAGSFYAESVYREVAPSDSCDLYTPAY